MNAWRGSLMSRRMMAARNFIEWRIEEFLDEGAAYVIVADKHARNEMRYRAAGIADCVFVSADWRVPTRFAMVDLYRLIVDLCEKNSRQLNNEERQRR